MGRKGIMRWDGRRLCDGKEGRGLCDACSIAESGGLGKGSAKSSGKEKTSKRGIKVDKVGGSKWRR